MNEEIRKALAGLNSEWSEFKKANDAVIAAAVKGHVDPLLKEKADALNAALTKSQKIVVARMDDLEKKMNRADFMDNFGGEDRKSLINRAQVFSKMLCEDKPRGYVAPEVSIEQLCAYEKAYVRWMQLGDSLPADERADLSVGSDPDGGFLVSPAIAGRIVEFQRESSPIRSVADIVMTTSDAVEDIRDLDEAASGGWVGERQSRPKTDTPQRQKYRIPVHEQYAMPASTQKMLDDAGRDQEAWLARKIADKLTRDENAAFTTGDGASKPRGFLTYPAGTPVGDGTAANFEKIARVLSGANGSFKSSNPGDELVDLVFSLKQTYRQRATFMMARLTVAAVRKLKDGDGNYLWQPDFAARQGGTLLGSPIIEGEDMPSLATGSLSIIYGDLRDLYLIVDRMGIRTLRDPFTDKPNVLFYTTKRVGGDVKNFDAAKIMEFSA